MDLILTWPRTRPLDSYVEEMKRAERLGQVVNFRVHNKPTLKVQGDDWERAWMVHDGKVRGYSHIVEIAERGIGEVLRVQSDPRGGYWPPGVYVVREAIFFQVEPIPMRGFQGFRYADPEVTFEWRQRRVFG